MNDTLLNDLGRWERGELSTRDLVKRHPQRDVGEALSIHVRMLAAAETHMPDPDPVWQRISNRIEPPRPTLLVKFALWLRRPMVAGAASVLVGGAAVAATVTPVREGLGDAVSLVAAAFGGDDNEDVSEGHPSSRAARDHKRSAGAEAAMTSGPNGRAARTDGAERAATERPRKTGTPASDPHSGGPLARGAGNAPGSGDGGGGDTPGGSGGTGGSDDGNDGPPRHDDDGNDNDNSGPGNPDDDDGDDNSGPGNPDDDDGDDNSGPGNADDGDGGGASGDSDDDDNEDDDADEQESDDDRSDDSGEDDD